jgi:maltooligosyltrehalose synthase
VLLPMLGDQYGVVLERGELQAATSTLATAAASRSSYYEHRLPVDPTRPTARCSRRAAQTLARTTPSANGSTRRWPSSGC